MEISRFKDKLIYWMSGNSSQDKVVVIKLVQQMKNVLSCTPCSAMFGIESKVGLTLPAEIIEHLESACRMQMTCLELLVSPELC